MSSVDTVTEEVDERTDGLAGSLAESLAPTVARHARSGNLAAASGAVSLVRAGRTFLKGDRKRGLMQAAAGLFWVGVALAQRRAGGDAESAPSGTTESSEGGDASEVTDTSPDIEDAVEPGDHGTDHATGEEVVDTTDADIEASDTESESGVSPSVESEDVDQRDVAGTDEIESAESSDGEEADAETADEDAETDDEDADEREAGTSSAE